MMEQQQQQLNQHLGKVTILSLATFTLLTAAMVRLDASSPLGVAVIIVDSMAGVVSLGLVSIWGRRTVRQLLHDPVSEVADRPLLMDEIVTLNRNVAALTQAIQAMAVGLSLGRTTPYSGNPQPSR